MKNSEEMVNSLLERRDRYATEQKKKKAIITRTVTSMCCVCLVALLGFGMWKGGSFNTPGVDTPGISAGQDDVTGKGTKDEGLSNGDFTDALPNHTGVIDNPSSDTGRDGVKVISIYEAKNEIDTKYKEPANGHIIFTYPLEEAMKEYGDSVLYDVRIYLFKNEAKVAFDNNPIKIEVERLQKLGCSVSIEIYGDNQFYFAVKAKKSHLDNFVASEDYGYFIKLADESSYLGGLIP